MGVRILWRIVRLSVPLTESLVHMSLWSCTYTELQMEMRCADKMRALVRSGRVSLRSLVNGMDGYCMLCCSPLM